MEKDQMETLLCGLLACGYRDLDVLEGSTINVSDVLDRLDDWGVAIEFNNYMDAMFQIGIDRVSDRMENTLMEMADWDQDDLIKATGGDYEDAERLRNMIYSSDWDLRDDVDFYFNFLDTHAYLVNNEEFYKRYFKDEIDQFEELTGFTLFQ